MKHRNPVPTHRQSPYKILDEAQPENGGRIFLRPRPSPCASLSCAGAKVGRCDVMAGTADGGCIFRLVVSRFNKLQRRCSCYPQQDSQHT